MHPVGTFQALPDRGGMTKESTCFKDVSGREARRSYNAVGGCRGESADVGKYAGAGATLGSCNIVREMFLLWDILCNVAPWYDICTGS